MNTTIQIKVKKALILPSITLLHTFCTIFLHKVQILYLNNKKPHVSSNLAQQVGFEAGQPAFSHARNCFPFSLDKLPLSKNCFLFVVLGDRQVALSSIIISWCCVQQPFFETMLRDSCYFLPTTKWPLYSFVWQL